MKKLLLFSILILMPYAYSMEPNVEIQPLIPNSSAAQTPALQPVSDATASAAAPATTSPQNPTPECGNCLDSLHCPSFVAGCVAHAACYHATHALVGTHCSIS